MDAVEAVVLSSVLCLILLAGIAFYSVLGTVEPVEVPELPEPQPEFLESLREYNFDRLKIHGRVLTETENAAVAREVDCNHRKGGMVSDDGSLTAGDDDQFAVIQHTYPWGDTWVRCLRCGKTWKPGQTDYSWALTLPTRNKPSASAQYRCDVAVARELTATTR